MRRLLAFLILGGGAAFSCRKTDGSATTSPWCEAPLVVLEEPIGPEAESLPIVAELRDVGAPGRHESFLGCGAEYGGRVEHEAKLGPLAARYTTTDYKGQEISANTALALWSPTCPGTVVGFTMAGPSFVRLRRDPARDVYVVTGGILDKRAIAVRLASSAK